MTKWVSHRSSNAEEKQEQAMWGTTTHRAQLSAREFLSEVQHILDQTLLLQA